MARSTPLTVAIEEQPARVLRFRYEREGRAGGSIVGACTTPENKTYPSIRIKGHKSKVLVIVSCVTKDEPYRPHPHKLVGKEGCNKGVCMIVVPPGTTLAEFTSLGIQCMRRKDIEDSLKLRKVTGIDPFRTGFRHAEQPSLLDLSAVRLCFQVLMEDEHGKFTVPLRRIVSEPIYDKRVVSDLVIVKLSKSCSPVDGGREEIILVCDKVFKDDIQIRFYEEQDGQVVWEGFGVFQPANVYKQLVIWFKPPSYKTLNVAKPVQVFIQLLRPSDGETSESLPFQFTPIESELRMLNRLREQKFKNELKNFLSPQLSNQEQNTATLSSDVRPVYDSTSPQNISIIDLPLQQQYHFLSVNPMVTPPINDPQHDIDFFDLGLNVASTSGTQQPLHSGQVYAGLNSAYTPILPLPLQQEYSMDSMSSGSPQANSQYNFLYTELMPATSQTNNCATAIVAETQNNFSANSNSSEMDIESVNNLSDLIDVDNQQPELQEIDLNSGELDAMNNTGLNDLQ